MLYNRCWKLGRWVSSACATNELFEVALGLLTGRGARFVSRHVLNFTHSDQFGVFVPRGVGFGLTGKSGNVDPLKGLKT